MGSFRTHPRSDRAALPLAGSVIVGSWALVAVILALVARLLGAGSVAGMAADAAVFLVGVTLLLLAGSAAIGYLVDRPRRESVRLSRGHAPVSGRIL
jgi:hypothetical protein